MLNIIYSIQPNIDNRCNNPNIGTIRNCQEYVFHITSNACNARNLSKHVAEELLKSYTFSFIFIISGDSEGRLFLKDLEADIHGSVPNITLDDNGTVILSFCCSDTYNGSSTLSDYLPKTFPFVFLKVRTTVYLYVQKYVLQNICMYKGTYYRIRIA